MPSAPTIGAIRTATKTLLDTIAGPLPGGGAGITHNRPRHTVRDEDVLTDFIDTDGVLRFTTIDVRGAREEEDEARHKFWLIWTIMLEHFHHFDDEGSSFVAFSDEVERIKDTFRQDSTIFGVPERDTQRVIQLDQVELVFIDKTLSHKAIMSMEVESNEIIAP